jgi:hypothetical protein
MVGSGIINSICAARVSSFVFFPQLGRGSDLNLYLLQMREEEDEHGHAAEYPHAYVGSGMNKNGLSFFGVYYYYYCTRHSLIIDFDRSSSENAYERAHGGPSAYFRRWPMDLALEPR